MPLLENTFRPTLAAGSPEIGRAKHCLVLMDPDPLRDERTQTWDDRAILKTIEMPEFWAARSRQVIMILSDIAIGSELFDLAGFIDQIQNYTVNRAQCGTNLTIWRGVSDSKATCLTIPLGNFEQTPTLDFFVMGREFFQDPMFSSSPYMRALRQGSIKGLLLADGSWEVGKVSNSLVMSDLLNSTLVVHEMEPFNHLTVYQKGQITIKPLAIELTR